MSERFPGFCCSKRVGTVSSPVGDPFTVLYCSKAPKKKVLPFLMGPPRLPPYWFWRYFGLGNPAEFEKKSFAFRTSFRKYSNNDPWKSLVPALVITLMTAPAERPTAAE